MQCNYRYIYVKVKVNVWVTQSRPTLCDRMDCGQPGSSVHGDYPDKNTAVHSHSLLQGIFPTQGLNPGLLHYRQILYHLSHQGRPHNVCVCVCVNNKIRFWHFYKQETTHFGLREKKKLVVGFLWPVDHWVRTLAGRDLGCPSPGQLVTRRVTPARRHLPHQTPGQQSLLLTPVLQEHCLMGKAFPWP